MRSDEFQSALRQYRENGDRESLSNFAKVLTFFEKGDDIQHLTIVGKNVWTQGRVTWTSLDVTCGFSFIVYISECDDFYTLSAPGLLRFAKEFEEHRPDIDVLIDTFVLG